MLPNSKETTMRQFSTMTAAVVLALVAVPATQAAGKVVVHARTPVVHNRVVHSPVIHNNVVATKVGVGVGVHPHNYLAVNGVKFNGGYFYKGIHHRQWSRWYWNARYGTYFYFDPFVQ